MGRNWKEYRPLVGKNILVLIAGVVWIGVGFMLSTKAIIWFGNYTGSLMTLFITISLVIGAVKGYYILTRVVMKNLRRIENLSELAFIGAFISGKTYILIIGMMLLGIFLRNSTLPKQFLAIIYLGVGLAMIISSYPYFNTLVARKDY